MLRLSCICGVTVRICIPTSFKARNDVQIQSKWEILMLFLNQNFPIFRMVHLVFL
jgi:hypothetical protein